MLDGEDIVAAGSAVEVSAASCAGEDERVVGESENKDEDELLVAGYIIERLSGGGAEKISSVGSEHLVPEQR